MGPRAAVLRHLTTAIAHLSVGAALGACSLIYDPGKIATVAPDAAPDAPPPDAAPDAPPPPLALAAVTPATLVEGQGAEGTRPAVLVVEGEGIAAGATVALRVVGTPTVAPEVTLDADAVAIAADGRRLAVPVSVAVATDFDTSGGAGVAYDVVVTQGPPGAEETQTLAGALVVHGLPELEDPAQLPAGGFASGTHTYARIALASGTIAPASGAQAPIILRSQTTLTLADAVTVNASGTTPGLAGGAGGIAGVGSGVITGGSGGGPGGGAGGGAQTSGDPGVFTAAPADRGTPFDARALAAFARTTSGGGGGGGGRAALGGLLPTNGGVGGGGGGSIAFVAEGAITLGDVRARGVAGATGGQGAGAGGGGSGGGIWVRSGVGVMAQALDVTGVPNAGAVRIDAPDQITATVAGATAYYRGPTWVAPPLITSTATPMVLVRGQPSEPFSYYVVDATGQMITTPVTTNMPAGGSAQFALGTPLFPGLNEVCFLVKGAVLSSDTQSCVSLAYIAP